MWALQGRVSRKRSAQAMRARWAAGSMVGANTRRAGSTPRAAASRRRLTLAEAAPSSCHSTLPGAPSSRRIQTSKTSGVILYGLLKLQNTSASGGSPTDAREGGGASARVLSFA